ncbi:MAG TPA: PEP-CTERM sorting domain-containing protein [Verrucomicrobiales bacterium]|nr:PEP-CTERM sorting domain-containing protein [Verrucomicrobiales bacterium]
MKNWKCISLLSSAVLFAAGVSGVAAVSVANGDFEQDTALFTVWPGYTDGGGVNPSNIPGWTGEGGRGINPVVPNGPGDAPFRDNGTNATSIAFLQGNSSISQQLTGFSVGVIHVISLDFNSRNCCGAFPIGEIAIDDIVLASSADLFPAPGVVPPVGDNPWYTADIPFLATSDTHVLTIRSIVPEGDATLLVDNISVAPIPEPVTLSLLLAGGLGLLALRRRRRK